MNRQDFETAITAEGYAPAHRTLEADMRVDPHDHAWDTKGLVLSGEFIIHCEGEARSFGPGEVFEMGAGIEHFEATGPDGAELVVGRRKAG